jgi:hypothetical protein
MHDTESYTEGSISKVISKATKKMQKEMSTWKGKLLLATITKLKFTLPPICHSRTFQFLKMWHREEMVI